ncbi:hypothetical protein KGV52_00675 [Candidatus Gracilibacteria bacterium]|nr:hypothetical protein [Candidatus Gracilibacteria bacterium]
MKHFGKATKIIVGLLIGVSCMGVTFANNTQTAKIEKVLKNFMQKVSYEKKLYVFRKIDEVLPVKKQQFVEKYYSQGEKDKQLRKKIDLYTDVLKISNKIKSQFLQEKDIKQAVKFTLPDGSFSIELPYVFRDAKITKEVYKDELRNTNIESYSISFPYTDWNGNKDTWENFRIDKRTKSYQAKLDSCIPDKQNPWKCVDPSSGLLFKQGKYEYHLVSIHQDSLPKEFKYWYGIEAAGYKYIEIFDYVKNNICDGKGLEKCDEQVNYK